MLLVDAPDGHGSAWGTVPDGRRVVCAVGDLVAAAECERAFLVRLDELLGLAGRTVRPADARLARTAALGAVHERQALDGYLARFGPASPDGGPGGVAQVAPARSSSWGDLVDARTRTLAAVEQGVDVVAGGVLFDGEFSGRTDFLVRDGAPAHGAGAPDRPRYAVWEATLARRSKVPALLRVAAGADQLFAAGVDPTRHGHLLLGTRERSHHLLGDVLPIFRDRWARVREIVTEHLGDPGPVAWGDPRFAACERLGVCPDCAAAAERHRDVLLVGGVYERQRAALVGAGITTIDALAKAEDPPPGMRDEVFRKVRFQAGLQLGTEPGDGRVRYAIGPDDEDGPREAELRWAMPDPAPVDRLPAPSPGDVFFDFEGDPWWTDARGDGPGTGYGLDYLFGWVTRPGAGDGASTAAGPPPFHGLWADTPAQERDALVGFVDWLNERRRRWPDLHVYHYADYEPVHLLSIAARHGVYEDEVDDLLRDGVLVDLWKVVRSAVRISHRSRSIKRLEPLYMGAEPGREGVTDGAASIVEYAEYAELRRAGNEEEAARRKAQILEYNRYDCVSTLRLLEWLRDARATVRGTGTPGTLPEPGPGAEQAPAAGRPLTKRQLEQERRAELEARVRAVVEAERTPSGAAPGLRSGVDGQADGQADGRADDVGALALLAGAVGYYRRESKPFWHEHLARLERAPHEWPGRRSALVAENVEVRRGWEAEDGRTTASRLLALRGRLAEGTELVAGARAFLLYDAPVPDAVGPLGPGAVRAAHPRAIVVESRQESGSDVLVVREQLRRTDAPYDALPMAVAIDANIPTGPQEQSVEEVAARALDAWTSTGTLPAGPAADLLCRRSPRLIDGGVLPGPTPGTDGEPDVVSAVLEAVRRLDRSFVAVQGPPGTGTTSLGSHVVARLVTQGWRVGVVARSRAVVEDMLGAVVRAGVPVERVANGQRDDDGSRPVGVPWQEVGPEQLAAFVAGAGAGAGAGDGAAGRGRVVGGTAWDFADARWPEEGLDLLVVDAAGRFSLADTVAVARAASRLLLLGDPQQLGQVGRGAHPESAVAGSALAWLTGSHEVLPERFGYFLPASHRMHTDLCLVVSRFAYDERLRAHPAAAARRLDGVEPGVRHVLVDHAGRSVASTEEADEVVRQVLAVVGRGWRPADGPDRPLGASDVLVVAAYDAQVAAVRRALANAGLTDVQVGTVDTLQGREAVVVVLTLAASSPDRAPRGMGYLLDRRRINVAISRGQWCAVVVRSPHLTDYLPHGVTGLEQLGAFLGTR